MLPVSKSWSLEIAGIAIPVIIIGLLWLPVFLHYRVSRVTITEDMIEHARIKPDQALLRELDNLRAYRVGKDGEKNLLADAEQLLRGVLILPGRSPQQIAIPFDSADLDKGLFVASLGVPKLLLTAYGVSGRREFLTTAKEIILEWARYEERAWLPRGLLWNDHALSERMIVLANFWRHYRSDPEYKPQEARIVLELAARTSALLAKPAHFTFATNHGVMQNLALWHYSLAFPTMPRAAEFRDLAFSRMRQQMSFQMSDEGVVLEHSPSYQLGGLIRLSDAIGYLILLNRPIPEEWVIKHERGKEFYRNLRLPDGSLPVFGDTSAGINYDERLVAEVADPSFVNNIRARPEPFGLYPVSGYAVWWSGLDKWTSFHQLAQVAMTWSHFPGHSHKHADEMSLWLWARGRRWITNIGDWPSRDGRRDATSWPGSNAPHLVGEPKNSSRSAKAHYYGSGKNLAFIDLERVGPKGFVARRQVLWIKPAHLLVVDHVRGGRGQNARTIWTVAHNTMIKRSAVQDSLLFEDTSADQKLTMAAAFLGSPQPQTEVVKGSFAPFAGWEVIGGHGVKATTAVVIEQPAEDSWAVSFWSLADDLGAGRAFGKFRMDRWIGGDHWRLTLPFAEGAMIERAGDRITYRGGLNEGSQVLNLTPAADSSNEYQALRTKLDETARAYPTFEDNFGYRVKATQLLIVLLLAQELLLLFSRFKLRTYYPRFRALTTASWSTVGVALILFFDHWIATLSGIGSPL